MALRKLGALKSRWMVVAPVAVLGLLLGFQNCSGFQAMNLSSAINHVRSSAKAVDDFGPQMFVSLPTGFMNQMSGGQSSTDVNEANADTEQYLYQSGSGKVLLDLQGPGTVYRIWATGFDAGASFQIFIDGESSPRVNTTWGQFFGGGIAPFIPPLTVTDQTSSGGFVSYVPIAYSKSIKIVAGSVNYYNIGYSSFSPETFVNSWTGQENLSGLVNAWNNITQDPKATNGDTTVNQNISVNGGQTTPIFEVGGAGSVSSIKLNIPGITQSNMDMSVLNNLFIRAYWDGESAPSVDAPLSMFFGMGSFGTPQAPTRALEMGMDSGNNFYIYFPMPYASHAHIELVNKGGASVSGIQSQVAYQTRSGLVPGTAYFKTRYQPLFTAVNGNDLSILNVTGSGSLVGVVIGYNNPASNTRGYLEGNERFYVDGAMSPQINGTGTEDFFNGGWYFSTGPYTQPMSGNPFHLNNNSIDQTVAYRLFIQDAVVFRNQIQASIQYGPRDDYNPTQATLLTYYYLQPDVQRVQTDTLNVGNTNDESAHAYSISGANFLGGWTYTYPGVLDTQPVSAMGRGHQGSSQFRAAILTNNVGVIVRRRLDAKIDQQKANVYVDGQLAGTWYDVGTNHVNSWKDSEFMIPASLTSGKSSITIEMRFVSSVQDWNEFTYWVSSIVPPPGAPIAPPTPTPTATPVVATPTPTPTATATPVPSATPVTPSTPPPTETYPLSYEAINSQHGVGHASGSQWQAGPSDGAGFMIYGPYTTSVASGMNLAYWDIDLGNAFYGTGSIFTVDVYDATAEQVLARQEYSYSDAIANAGYVAWNNTLYTALPFDFTGRAGHRCEFRVWSYAKTTLTVTRTVIRQ